jgi:hypothetical protein
MRGVRKQHHTQVVFVLGMFYDYDMLFLACNVMVLKTLWINVTPFTHT